jgi:hypothetical protein
VAVMQPARCSSAAAARRWPPISATAPWMSPGRAHPHHYVRIVRPVSGCRSRDRALLGESEFSLLPEAVEMPQGGCLGWAALFFFTGPAFRYGE